MTYVEALYEDITEARIPTGDIPAAAPPTADADDPHCRLLNALERRLGLLDLRRGLQLSLDAAYESGEDRRITWARTDGRAQLRDVAAKLLIIEATIGHLCQYLCPMCVDGVLRASNPDNDRRCDCTPDDEYIPL